jgi:cell fate (sporulation/competence/biofilm development) regulator YlbF (YheA/YmcA/DUF963 family)
MTGEFVRSWQLNEKLYSFLNSIEDAIDYYMEDLDWAIWEVWYNSEQEVVKFLLFDSQRRTINCVYKYKRLKNDLESVLEEIRFRVMFS